MAPRHRRKLWWILAAAVAVVLLGAALAVPALIDANRYRGLIEARAREALGRDVRLGEMRVSLWPVFGVRVDDLSIGALPEEGPGDLLVADSLRVGARLLPLLQRRLEVKSLVLQSPDLRLERGRDGRWNVERLLASDTAGGDGGAGALRISKFRVSEGRIRLRDAGPSQPKPVEAVIEQLELKLDDFAPDRPFDVELAATVADKPRSRLRFAGRVGPLGGEALALAGELRLQDVVAPRLLELAGQSSALPSGLVGDRPFSLTTRVDAAIGPQTRIALEGLELRNVDLLLRRAKDGSWNLPAAAGGPTSADSTELVLSGLRMSDARVRLDDRSSGMALTLDGLKLSLDRLPTTGPASIELSATLDSGGDRGSLSVRGRLGPLAESGGTPTELAVRVDPIPPALLRQVLGETVQLELRPSGARLAVDLAGTPPRRLELRGTAELAGARVRSVAPDGSARSAKFDLGARYDVVALDDMAKLQIRSLALDIDGHRLELKGAVEQRGDAPWLDLELAPTRVPADDLAALLSMFAPELPVAFASQTPVELQGRVRGALGGDRLPEIDGRVRLADFTLRHPTMSQPVERVGAEITVRGQQVEIASFRGVVGSSDVAGRIGVDGFEQPRVTFDLRSGRADLGQLFSFLRTDEGQAASPAAGSDALTDLLLDGTIRIERGSFETLDFEQLEARMRHAAGVVTLDPVSTQLYGGSFRGRVTADLGSSPPAFTILGEASDVDTDAFLADNVDSPGLLSGRFSGRVETRGTGLDYEAIVRGLKGTGAMEVREGRVGRLDVLRTLSKVSGVFGESTLKQVSRRMAKEGTEFHRLSSGLRVDGGQLAFDDLLLDSAVFTLQGRGTLDMLTTRLDGQFRLAFSSEISQAMRSEKSRAAEVFWNARSGRVELPFSLAGPFDAPTPGIDFRSVARDALKDKAEEGLRGLLDKRLERGAPPADVPTEPPSEPTQAPAQEPAPGEPPASAAGLVAEIGAVRWGGSVLARDLKLEGTVRGADLAGASVSVRDARGIEIKRVDRLSEVQNHLASAPDASAPASIPWKLSVDGKKLLAAKFPVTVTLTVTDTAGNSVESERRVER